MKITVGESPSPTNVAEQTIRIGGVLMQIRTWPSTKNVNFQILKSHYGENESNTAQIGFTLTPDESLTFVNILSAEVSSMVAKLKE